MKMVVCDWQWWWR